MEDGGFVMAEKLTYDELVQRVKTLENEAAEHRKAEEGLREDEKRYRLLVEKMSDGLAIFDENSLNTYANGRFCQMLGYSSDDILGRPVTDFLDESGKKIVEEQIGERKKGKSGYYELEWTRKDGEKISTIVSPSPILDDEDKYEGAFAVVIDISELKKTQKELRKSLSLFSATLDSTADGILVVDREGKVVSFNKKFVEMWRIPDSIIEARESDQALASVLDQLEDPESFLKKVRALYSRPNEKSFDVLDFKDGRIFERYSQPQRIEGNSVGRVWSFRNVTDRKKGEEALRESEARYRILFENASEAIYVAQDGMIKFHNPRTEELCGYSKEELNSQPFTYFIHEEDREMVLDRHKRRLEGERPRSDYPFRIVNKSGDTKWVELKVAEIHWDKRPAILCFMTDIDVRIQAEKALKESEEKYRTILENVVDGYYEVDLAGNLTFVNDSLCKMTGFTRDELIGMNNLEYMDEENTKRVYKIFSGVYETGNSVKGFEYEIIQPKDASKRGVESSVALIRDTEWQPTGFRGVLRDVTERKQAEQLLRESKESLDRAQKLSHIGSWSRDLKTDQAEWSDEMYRILGLTPGNPKHPTHEEFLSRVHPVERENIARGFKEAVKTKRPFEFEFRTVPIEGLEKIIHVRGKVKCDDTGVPIRNFGTNQDITEIRRLQGKIQEAQKMEAIATLAGGIAHRFNNALTPIIGHVDLLEMKHSEDENTMESLKYMKTSGRHMADLTSQLLAYSRGGKYNPQVLSLSDFVEATLPLIKHIFDPAVRVETDLPLDVMDVKADSTQMQMVLSAIIANSNEAIEASGRIRISTRNMDLDKTFIMDHPGLMLGPHVCLSIEDDGKGMDEETRRRIFDPFFTTHFMGRGLGMASVYGIIKNHDGSITVDSEPGKGTVVSIYLLAIKAEEEVKRKVVSRLEPESPTDKATILIIEDEEDVMVLTRQVLETLGYRVLLAETGKKAVEIAKTFDGQIDLALLDIKLPDMGGDKVYPLIIEARPNLKVIVCSGYSIDGPPQDILDAGAEGFIQKPFSISVIADKLKEVLGEN